MQYADIFVPGISDIRQAISVSTVKRACSEYQSLSATLMQYTDIFVHGISDIRQAISINPNLEEAAELTRKAFIEEKLENVKIRAVFFAKL